MRKVSLVRQIFSQLFFFLIGLYVILPIWGVLRLAFDGSLYGRATSFRLFPKEFAIDSFLKVLDRPYQSVDFLVLFRNSMVVSLGAAILALLCGGALAFAFARFRFPGRRPALFILLLTAVLPPIAFTIPLYIVLSVLDIRTTLMGLIVVYAVFAFPFCVWNMRAGFQSVPKEMEEAAYLDGAGIFSTFWKITIPLAFPSISLAGLIAFLMAYSEFAIGWFFVEKASTVTMAMAIYAMVQSGSAQPWSMLGSLAIIMSVPVVVVFLILQNSLVNRMMFTSPSE